MKTYQLQPTESLRKNSSAKFANKGRENNTPSQSNPTSQPKSTNKHNISTDKLALEAQLDSSLDLKKNRVEM